MILVISESSQTSAFSIYKNPSFSFHHCIHSFIHSISIYWAPTVCEDTVAELYRHLCPGALGASIALFLVRSSSPWSTITAGKQLEEKFITASAEEVHLETLGQECAKNTVSQYFQCLQSYVPEWCWVPWEGGQSGPSQFGAILWHLGPKAGCFFMKKTVCSCRGSKPSQGVVSSIKSYHPSFLPQPQPPN